MRPRPPMRACYRLSLRMPTHGLWTWLDMLMCGCLLGTRASPLDSSPIEPLQWMVTPLWRGVRNLSLSHFVIKLILTSKGEPPPKRLLHLRGNFLRTGGVQEQGASLLTELHTNATIPVTPVHKQTTQILLIRV